MLIISFLNVLRKLKRNSKGRRAQLCIAQWWTFRTLASGKVDFHYTIEDGGDSNSMPIITLEIMSDSSNNEHSSQDPRLIETQEPGIHFHTDKNEDSQKNDDKDVDLSKEAPKGKNDLLEYLMRDDGSVVCKLCGEILQSRTHWYRHKYKLHVIQPLNPAPLFQCEQCLVYFKSRKGYIGHIASRHSEILADSSPVISNTQIEAAKEKFPIKAEDIKEEPDPELSIPTTSVPNYQNVIKPGVAKPVEPKKMCKPRVSTEFNMKEEWEEKRLREEKLVADIIDRVRRECEAQGAGGATRRGYTRRTTVMHS